MALINFTSFEEVRAALGVSTTELTDAVIDLPMYGIKLSMDLEDVHDGIPATYASIALIDPSARTAVQTRFYEVVRLFSTYAVAKHLCTSLPMFSLKVIRDGRAEGERNIDYYKDLRDDLDASLIALRYRMSVIYGQVVTGIIPLTRTQQIILALSPLGVDPVTGA